jgi:D-xylose transport system substrate-binding protein
MRLLKTGIVMILILIILTSSAGCIRKNKPAAFSAKVKINGEQSTIKFGLSLPSQQEDRWIMDLEAIQAECDRLGIELLHEYADMNPERQEAQCQSMLAKGIRLLILVPYDAKKAAGIIKEAHAKKVKVISYDRLTMDTDVDLYISFNNEKVGELMGKAVTAAVPSGNYVVFSGAPNDRNSYYLTQGLLKIVKPLIDQGKIKTVMQEPVVDWSPDNAYKLMNRAIREYGGDIQAVVAPNDGTASGCIKALSEHGLTGKIVVTGQDAELSAARRILNGTQLMTVFKDTRLLGKKTVELSLKMIRGETFEAPAKMNNHFKDVPTFLIDPVAVTAKNLDAVLIKSGYFTKTAVYSK